MSLELVLIYKIIIPPTIDSYTSIYSGSHLYSDSRVQSMFQNLKKMNRIQQPLPKRNPFLEMLPKCFVSKQYNIRKYIHSALQALIEKVSQMHVQCTYICKQVFNLVYIPVNCTSHLVTWLILWVALIPITLFCL